MNFQAKLNHIKVREVLRTKIIYCLFHGQSWKSLVIDRQASPFVLVLKKVETDTIVISSESKSNAKIFVSWGVIEVPQDKAFDIINFLALDLLIYCVFVVLDVQAIVNLKC